MIIDDANSQDAKIADLDAPVEVEDETTEPEEVSEYRKVRGEQFVLS